MTGKIARDRFDGFWVLGLRLVGVRPIWIVCLTGGGSIWFLAVVVVRRFCFWQWWVLGLVLGLINRLIGEVEYHIAKGSVDLFMTQGVN